MEMVDKMMRIFVVISKETLFNLWRQKKEKQEGRKEKKGTEDGEK
jgi:hypothetical protein